MQLIFESIWCEKISGQLSELSDFVEFSYESQGAKLVAATFSFAHFVKFASDLSRTLLYVSSYDNLRHIFFSNELQTNLGWTLAETILRKFLAFTFSWLKQIQKPPFYPTIMLLGFWKSQQAFPWDSVEKLVRTTVAFLIGKLFLFSSPWNLSQNFFPFWSVLFFLQLYCIFHKTFMLIAPWVWQDFDRRIPFS